MKGWRYSPVVQTSQVGYHPAQKKVAVLEMDARDNADGNAKIFRISENGEEEISALTPVPWGQFLRYNYATLDFSSITAPGLYRIRYKGSESSIFRIGEDVYDSISR